MNAETERWLALSLVSGVGPGTLSKMLERFGSADALLSAPAEELSRRCGLSPQMALAILESPRSQALEQEKALLERHGVRLLRRSEPDYPARLDILRLPPPLLYLRAKQPLPIGPALAVVGTRRCTRYGETAVRRLIREVALAQPGTAIVSGLARGIDTAAHQQALECGLPTIAVLAGGLSRVFPPENEDLAERIVENGALITEFSMTTAPLGKHFAMRNRIISALSLGVLVAEADTSSGALITAGFAQNHRLPVMAVPGNLDSPSFTGCNHLIRTGQATLVTQGADILEILRKGLQPAMQQLDLQISESRRKAVRARKKAPAKSREKSPLPAERPARVLEGDAGRVVEALAGEPLHPNDLSANLGLPMEKLAGLLLELELSGEIVQTPQNFYALA